VPHDPRALPEFTSWPTFPFEGDLRVKALEEPAEVEPPRQGEDPEACTACQAPDVAYIWVSDRWRVRALDRPSGLPMVLILESRSHLDIGDLPNLLAAELGVMTVRLERAIRSIEGVARVHINRWGDGSAHLHLWFLARPYGRLQLRGTFLSLWDDILPPIAEPQWRENLAMVAAWLAEFGGRPLAMPPPIDWKAPTRLDSREPLTADDNVDADHIAGTETASGERISAESADDGGAGGRPGRAGAPGDPEAAEQTEHPGGELADTPELGAEERRERIEAPEPAPVMEAAADVDEAVVRVRPRPSGEYAEAARAPESLEDPATRERADGVGSEAADQARGEPAGGQGADGPGRPAETRATGPGEAPAEEAAVGRAARTGSRRKATAAGKRRDGQEATSKAVDATPTGADAPSGADSQGATPKAAKGKARQRVLAPDPADPEEAWEEGV
jgi:hypothetical protein